jgi:hypothetical protein
MPLVYGNPFSEVHELFRQQGALDHLVDSVHVTGGMSVKNAEGMQFEITALNMRFGITMEYISSSGIPLLDAAGVAIAPVVIIPPATIATLVAGRKSYTVPLTLPAHGDFVRFTLTYRADTAYVPPMPASTGVANLYNSALSIKDELAPLLEVKAKLVNPKP